MDGIKFVDKIIPTLQLHHHSYEEPDVGKDLVPGGEAEQHHSYNDPSWAWIWSSARGQHQHRAGMLW